MLIWPTVANPLTAPTALDDVLLGIDEDANVLWAIERRADGVELVEPDEPAPPTATSAPVGQVVVTDRPRYRYLPSTSVPPPVAPVRLVGRRQLPPLRPGTARRPHRASGRAPRRARPAACCATRAQDPPNPAHAISPAAVPRAGVRLDRRYVLGRRTDGQPVLWVQRRRTPLGAPPVSALRFDVLEEMLEVRA